MIEDLQNNDDLDLFNSLLLEVDEADLEKFTSGGHNLLQKACYSSKTYLVNSLLEHGMNVNGMASGTKMAPILISASLGDKNTLETLLTSKPDLTVTKEMSKENLLHCYLKQDHERDPEYLKILLNQRDDDQEMQMRSIINKKDINQNTALHYAAQRWPQEAVR